MIGVFFICPFILFISSYVYVWMYVCMRVCVCVRERERESERKRERERGKRDREKEEERGREYIILFCLPHIPSQVIPVMKILDTLKINQRFANSC